MASLTIRLLNLGWLCCYRDSFEGSAIALRTFEKSLRYKDLVCCG